MNPFVFACIAPHGGEIIPELKGSHPSRMQKTRDSMQELGERMQAAKPDAIIVLTPHGTRVEGFFSISNSERMEGIVEENGSVYRMERLVERNLALSITEAAKENALPAATINYGTSAGPISCLQLDWGAIVPLSFMPDVPIVVITPSREVPLDVHYRFGEVLAQAVKRTKLRVGLIASCDWSHAHHESGPYGYNPAAKLLDEDVVTLIKSGQLEKMSEFDPEYVDAAKPDGIWQTMILAGTIPADIRHTDLLSYEVPTYFGLICAEIH
ncbi:extradiol ring-cleavage dioxygenase [Heyndrickxia acidicola]|uniref:Extradiol ring-cleavage dioxygenase n=1 Tax=Heyndrickxia acidicola TaxID=209389 RepID=A0ABU6MF46_9BACI|nr:extradiol ring-cleavage dioxygenase [Heyndrickxia acidicola]MED1203305.1 extradiol ring-cleavage dioxygenase [Heyndrickxia acidicola]